MPANKTGEIYILPEDQKALKRLLGKLKYKFPASAVSELREWGKDVKQQVQNNAPVDTGFLRDNIDSVNIGSKRTGGVAVRSNATYSGYVEYGTRHTLPEPFFFNTVSRFTRDLIARLYRLLDRIASNKTK